MKILVGFDGSDCARAAIEELRLAGLPARGEAVVLSVADLVTETPLTAYGVTGEPIHPALSTAALEAMRLASEKALAEAQSAAAAGVDLLAGVLPGWNIRAEALADSPYWALVRRAGELKSDLLVVGSHGRSAMGRLVFGSVAQNVLSHAPCSVRIGRRMPVAAGDAPAMSGAIAAPLRLLLAVDASPDSALATEALRCRRWPSGTEVRVVTVIDPRWSTVLYGLGNWLAEPSETPGGVRVSRLTHAVARELQEVGLNAAPVVLDGTARRLLVHEAEAWGANCIFLGARGHSRLERFLVGSVSAAVAARAHCSVEVVRQGA